MGAVNFPMCDIYGFGVGTTETTIPEADDQTALVDDQKASDTAQPSGAKRIPIYLAIALMLILVIVLGGRF